MVTNELLEAFDLEDQFIVVQPDAMRIRCTDCGTEISAECADLHLRFDCPEQA